MYPCVLLLINDKLFRNSGLIIYGLSIALGMLIGLIVMQIESHFEATEFSVFL